VLDGRLWLLQNLNEKPPHMHVLGMFESGCSSFSTQFLIHELATSTKVIVVLLKQKEIAEAA